MKKTIPLFFAVDDNYSSFLSVTLESIFENASNEYFYDVIILNIGLKDESKKIIDKYNSENVNIIYYDVRNKLKKIASNLAIRDYYSKATYYRLFIADLFPQYSKAIYLDCDIVVLGDISKLYNHDLGNNLVGAVPDGAVQITDEFVEYVNKGLGIKEDNYFNAGVLLMNLDEFRKYELENKFIELLNKYTFEVAQDQDYLNVLTKNRVTYIDDSWNVMPLGNYVRRLNLIHYNLSFKPWKYDNIQYEEYFWDYAKKAKVENQIRNIKDCFSLEDMKKDIEGGKKLKQKALEEAYNKNNYYSTYVKKSFLKKVINKIKYFLTIHF